jgi:hypothetical protein
MFGDKCTTKELELITDKLIHATINCEFNDERVNNVCLNILIKPAAKESIKKKIANFLQPENAQIR